MRRSVRKIIYNYAVKRVIVSKDTRQIQLLLEQALGSTTDEQGRLYSSFNEPTRMASKKPGVSRFDTGEPRKKGVSRFD